MLIKKIFNKLTNKPIENNFYPQDLWNKDYENHSFQLAPKDHSLVRFLYENLPKGSGDAIEIGCCPGTFCGHFGHMGYTVHGVDLSPSIHKMEKYFQVIGIPTGHFYEKDFFDFCKEHNKTYNIVSSFGFIEHFSNYEEVFTLHTKLVADNGYLVVTFPNFLGSLQFALHSLFDKENLSLHNISAMDVDVYTRLAEQLGFKVLFSGYFGGFDFWRGHGSLLPKKDFALMSLYKGIQSLLEHKAINSDSMEWSSIGGIIAKKSN